MAGPELLVDPAVSRAKFEREVAAYRVLEDEQLRKGCFLLKAEYPEVFAIFAAPQLKPPAIVFGVVLDFSNYDLWPPSVRLVHPFTRVPYTGRELPTVLNRQTPAALPAGLPFQMVGQVVQVSPLMQFHGPDDVPFLCLPGVREYHEHPGHTGDSWLLHRGKGEGTLYFLLEKLHTYGVQPLNGYQIGLAITGFSQDQAPE